MFLEQNLNKFKTNMSISLDLLGLCPNLFGPSLVRHWSVGVVSCCLGPTLWTNETENVFYITPN